MLFMAVLLQKFILALICFCFCVSIPVMGYTSFQVKEDPKNPLVFSFTLLAQAPPTGSTMSSLRYDFGDGESSIKESPVHSYTKPGKYSPSLTILWSDSSGNIYTTVTTMTLEAGKSETSPQLTQQKTYVPTFIETPRMTGTTRYIPTAKQSFGPLPKNITTITRSYPSITMPQLNYATMPMFLPSYNPVASYTMPVVTR